MANRTDILSVLKTLLVSCAIVVAVTFTLVPFLHNHEADLDEHDTCPSHIIRSFLVSVTVIFTTIYLFLLERDDNNIPLLNAFIVSDRFSFFCFKRGPP